MMLEKLTHEPTNSLNFLFFIQEKLLHLSSPLTITDHTEVSLVFEVESHETWESKIDPTL